MKAVERTIQNLIGSGMDPKTENNPYLGFIYTSFQERATKVRNDMRCSFSDPSHKIQPCCEEATVLHIVA